MERCVADYNNEIRISSSKLKRLSVKTCWTAPCLSADDIINGILQHSDADGGTGIRLLALPPALFSVAGPVGMIRPMIVSFRMGHQAKDAPGGVTDASDIPQ